MRNICLLALTLLPMVAFAQGEPGSTPKKTTTKAGAKAKSTPAAAPGGPAAATPSPAPTAGEPGGPAAATPPPVAPASTATFDHNKTLESVAARADALAARMATTREKVLALRSEIISDSLAPTRLLLTHQNEMGASFRIESIEYKLDNVLVAERSNPVLDALGQLQILDGEVRPGNHEIRVLVTYVGTGQGPYPTLNGFRYEVKRTLKFEVAEGRLTQVQVQGFPKTDASLEARQRFDFRLHTTSTPLASAPGDSK